MLSRFVFAQSARLRRSSRPGFTVVELVLALFALNVALFALVAGGSVLLRRTTELRARSAAVEAVTNRVQRLIAASCAPTTGSASADQLTEHWTVSLTAPAVREISDSVRYTVGPMTRIVVLRTRSAC